MWVMDCHTVNGVTAICCTPVQYNKYVYDLCTLPDSKPKTLMNETLAHSTLSLWRKGLCGLCHLNVTDGRGHEPTIAIYEPCCIQGNPPFIICWLIAHLIYWEVAGLTCVLYTPTIVVFQVTWSSTHFLPPEHRGRQLWTHSPTDSQESPQF